MSTLSKLIGEKVIKGKAEEFESSRFEGSGKVLGLYFSAHWCPPCRAFTPQLAQWYQKVKESSNGNNFDIVFLSSDRDEAGFDEYFKEMPWYAVPYSARKLKNDLSRKFKVTGIPTLVFVNTEKGDVITTDGRSIVMEDPEGKDFPWTPKPVLELLSGSLHEIRNGKRIETTWDRVKENVDYVGIYFSAHWCGPCRSFTPQLVNAYHKVKEAGKKFEIIFCSSDRDTESFDEYYSSMPWLALPFGDSRKKSLSRVFDVSGIPTLVIVDRDGKVVTSSARAAISSDPDGVEFPWEPKPVNVLTGMTAAEINENPAVIWFTDGSKEAMATAEISMKIVAEEVKKDNPDSDLLFYYTGKDEEDDIAKSLRSFAKFPEKTPLLTVVDIPNQMRYVSDAESVSEKDVRDIAKGYSIQSLQGQPLR